MLQAVGNVEGTDRAPDALRDCSRDRRVGPGQQGGELVAAYTCHYVATAEALRQRPRHRLQNPVPGFVAVLIVDRPQVVNVDRQDGVVLAERSRQCALELAPVGERGENVGGRDMGDGAKFLGVANCQAGKVCDAL